MSNLFDLSEAERRRHDALVGVLGDPSTAQEGELCVFLARWLGASDVEILVGMARRQADALTARYRTLVAETVAYIDAKHPATSPGWEVMALPEGVVRRLHDLATD